MPRAYPEGSPRPVSVAIAPGTHRQVKEVSDRLTREFGRLVTISEAIEIALKRSGLAEDQT